MPWGQIIRAQKWYLVAAQSGLYPRIALFPFPKYNVAVIVVLLLAIAFAISSLLRLVTLYEDEVDDDVICHGSVFCLLF